MQLKICIAISVYDAFDDAEISASIVRENWNLDHELYIVLGMSKKDTSDMVDRSMFDSIIEVPTPNTKYLQDDNEGDNGKAARSSRAFNSIYLTGRKAVEENCDYIFYLNSGSWVLDPDQIDRLIFELEDRVFAIRIAARNKYLIVDDHFMLVNLKKALHYDIYNIDYSSRQFNPVSMSLNEIHGMLMMWVSMAPYGEIYVYSNHATSVNHLGELPNTFNPLIFDTVYNFLHSNKGDKDILFLRKKYVEKFVKNKSKYIKKHLEDYPDIPPNGFSLIRDKVPHYLTKGNKNKKVMWERVFWAYDKQLVK